MQSYDFTHDRIREVTYAEIGPAMRCQLHSRVADALEIIYGKELDAVSGELAVHCARANLVPKAVHYYQRAASMAR